MARKFTQGFFTPKNPQKYIGKGKIIFRSSWELTFMRFCDTKETILEWASEPLRIPYVNPLTNKKTTYVPDFLIRYIDKEGSVHVELIEIKPYNQSKLTEGMNLNQRATVALNHAKWTQAKAWCKQQGITFRVITEKDIYLK